MASALKTSLTKEKVSKAVLICIGTGVTVSIGAFLADYMTHTFLRNKFKSALEMQKLGEKVPLDDNLKKLFDSVLDDLEFSKDTRKYYEPFTVGGFEVYHGGIPTRRFSAFIGIPINFTYKDVQAIEASDIRIGMDRESLNIYHPAAEDLLESLVLSDKAKKFAIAREILMAEKKLPIYRAVESPVIFISSIFLAEAVRIQMKLAQKPVLLTYLTYAVSGAMGMMMWFQLRDATNTFFEKRVDKELAELGKDYVEGGKEYYKKILKRNIALRTLLGAYGPKVYKTDGDEVITIRQKRTPISYRKKFFEEYTFTDSAQQAA